MSIYLQHHWLYFIYKNIATIWAAKRLRFALAVYGNAEEIRLTAQDSHKGDRQAVATWHAGSVRSPLRGVAVPQTSRWRIQVCATVCAILRRFYLQGKALVLTDNPVCRKNILKSHKSPFY